MSLGKRTIEHCDPGALSDLELQDRLKEWLQQ